MLNIPNEWEKDGLQPIDLNTFEKKFSDDKLDCIYNYLKTCGPFMDENSDNKHTDSKLVDKIYVRLEQIQKILKNYQDDRSKLRSQMQMKEIIEDRKLGWPYFKNKFDVLNTKQLNDK